MLFGFSWLKFIAMKTLILFISFLFFTNLSFSQDQYTILEKEVPVHIVKNFSSKFPGALKVDWESSETGIYTATFLYGDNTWNARYAANGDLLVTEESIPHKHFPVEVGEAVGNYLHEDFRIVTAYRVNHFNFGSYYSVKTMVNGQELDVQVHEDGTMISGGDFTATEDW